MKSRFSTKAFALTLLIHFVATWFLFAASFRALAEWKRTGAADSIMAHRFGLGCAARVDVRSALPPIWSWPFGLLLLSHASLDDRCRPWFRILDSTLLSAKTPDHLTNR